MTTLKSVHDECHALQSIHLVSSNKNRQLMAAAETLPETEILLKITTNMLRIPSELEELADQLATGNADVREKFQELNLRFIHHLLELKKLLQQLPSKDTEDIQTLIRQLEGVLTTTINNNLQLTKHSSSVIDYLTSLEIKLQDKLSLLPSARLFQHELETFKLKLEILRLRFVIGNVKLNSSYRNNMDQASRLTRTVLNEIKSGNLFTHDSLHQKVRRIYKHMKRAVRNI